MSKHCAALMLRGVPCDGTKTKKVAVSRRPGARRVNSLRRLRSPWDLTCAVVAVVPVLGNATDARPGWGRITGRWIGGVDRLTTRSTDEATDASYKSSSASSSFNLSQQHDPLRATRRRRREMVAFRKPAGCRLDLVPSAPRPPLTVVTARVGSTDLSPPSKRARE